MARPTGPIISVQHRLFSAPLGDPLRCVEYSGVLREEVEPGDQRAVRRAGLVMGTKAWWMQRKSLRGQPSMILNKHSICMAGQPSIQWMQQFSYKPPRTRLSVNFGVPLKRISQGSLSTTCLRDQPSIILYKHSICLASHASMFPPPFFNPSLLTHTPCASPPGATIGLWFAACLPASLLLPHRIWDQRF